MIRRPRIVGFGFDVEVLYLARLPGHPDDLGGLDDAGWTDVERATVDELRWWSLPELAGLEAAGTEVYPVGLSALVTDLMVNGWLCARSARQNPSCQVV